jgi:hypothetical protein
MRGRVDILLPGLFDLPLGELDPALIADGLPSLNRLLRLAAPLPNRAFTIDAILRRVLQLDTDAASSLPLAQACAADADEPAGRLLLMQAAHLRADLQHAVLVPVQGCDSDESDIDILINDLSDFFQVDCDIAAIADGQYLMRLKKLEAPNHYPHILSVLGKSVNPYIEQSRGNLAWYRLVNEMQMFLHQHAINHERVARGLPAINSLWFWGGGSAAAADEVSLRWYCDDALLNRFAASQGLQPESLQAIDQSPPSTAAVIIDLRLLEALKSNDRGDLAPLLLDIDRRLLRPLLSAARGRRRLLLLRAGFDYDFYLPPSANWKFWRRPRSLGDWTATRVDL